MKKQFYLVAIFFLFSFTKSFCQAGIYLKIDGIDNKQPGAHANEFLVTSFETTDTIAVSVNSTGGGGGNSGKPHFGAIKLQKVLVPSANPVIMLDMAEGKHLLSATITWYDNTDAAYYQIRLRDVLIESVSILSPACSGTSCNNLYEEIHLAYSQIQWRDPVSGATSGWDLRLNRRL